ncbi:MAG: hypothetical protein N0C84_00555 [Candidatus Thiodiazotropha taylori]|uniref:Phosphomannomutase n=1 Tax=Candidatus Thiodiazotropha taylori TaxID=2792791 RepID=A0A9E4K828_9GAMM|nr:hypothetical protein [Candidatus Thiodiazotropha taylori]MCW4254935.1 hypothetical protein [Candidatus Thiodiazotropha taylori]
MAVKYIFDVDGTLTPSRQLMDYEFKAFFNTFCLTNDVYLVTGSDRPKTLEQIGHTYDLCKRVYQCSGNEVWEGSNLIHRNDVKMPLHMAVYIRDMLQTSDFKPDTDRQLEERTATWNASVVGRGCSDEARQRYIDHDKATSERQRFAEQFNTTYRCWQATIGGETGLDISPAGWGKSQILKDFSHDDELYFFGDQTAPDGNDHDIFWEVEERRLGIAYTVRDWKQTWDILKELE